MAEIRPCAAPPAGPELLTRPGANPICRSAGELRARRAWRGGVPRDGSPV